MITKYKAVIKLLQKKKISNKIAIFFLFYLRKTKWAKSFQLGDNLMTHWTFESLFTYNNIECNKTIQIKCCFFLSIKKYLHLWEIFRLTICFCWKIGNGTNMPNQCNKYLVNWTWMNEFNSIWRIRMKIVIIQ